MEYSIVCNSIESEVYSILFEDFLVKFDREELLGEFKESLLLKN